MEMAVPLLDNEIFKKRVNKFKRRDLIVSVKTKWRRPQRYRPSGQKKRIQGFHFDTQHWI